MIDENSDLPNQENIPQENEVNPTAEQNINTDAGAQIPQSQVQPNLPAWHIQNPNTLQPTMGNMQYPYFNQNQNQNQYQYQNQYFAPPLDPVTEEKRNISKTANGIGGMLLVKIGVEYALSIILALIVIIYLLVSKTINFSSYDFTDPTMATKFVNDVLAYFTGDGLISSLINMFLYLGIFSLPILFYKIFSHRKFTELFPLKYQYTDESEGQNKKRYTKDFSDFVPALFICMAASLIGAMFSSIIESLINGIHLQSRPLPFTAPTDVTGFIVFFLSIAILPAILEEFMFRGIILQSLRKYGDGLAILISAALFGLMHGNITQIPYAFIIGLIIGYFVVKQGSLWIGIFIHFFNNGIGAVASLISQQFGSKYDTIFSYSYELTIILLGIISLIYLITKNKGEFMLPKKAPSSAKLPAGSAGKAFFLSPTIIIFILYVLFSCALFLQIMPI
jgi:membrane protease YdiL (CAAX protease family)